MKLTVLGSRSDGNAYVLQNEGEALLLEAGLPFSKALKALDYQTKKVVGCLVTHDHRDHAGYISDYLGYGIKVMASKGTVDGMVERFAVCARKPTAVPYAPDGTFQTFTLGGFTILPFPTIHDTAEPTGYYIHHAETGSVLFATDTGYLPHRFAGLSNVLIEANYDKETLDERFYGGEIDTYRYRHVREGHMSIDTTIKALLANDISKVNNIVLLHLSQENADPVEFQRWVHEATGKTVHVARPWLEIDFNATPF